MLLLSSLSTYLRVPFTYYLGVHLFCNRIASQNWHHPHLDLSIAGMHAPDQQLKTNIHILPVIAGQSIG
ncbi:hypothetical protein M758_9G187100 [Ceratodon purpureus]|nr:hypothetical protein M758_9G187100 [Ceratodon purpureus]